MATPRHHLNPRGRRLARVAALAGLLLTGLVLPSTARAYDWPVKPFDRQHPVRGMFGDPRIGDGPSHSHSFHFGVDVSAPDGTAVYATLTGTAVIDPANPEVVYVRPVDDASLLFAYWHVIPAVHDGQFVVSRRTVVGRIARGWEHVHFAEQRNGRYVNPLRPGAMAPYADTTRPRVHVLGVERDGVPVGKAAGGRAVDLVAEVKDETPLPIAGRWRGRPVMPALVRWRLRGPRGSATGWRVAADFRLTMPSNEHYADVYARWTRQNKAWRDGRYRVVLARRWPTAGLRRGTYVLEVAASDVRGNTGTRRLALSVDDAGLSVAGR